MQTPDPVRVADIQVRRARGETLAAIGRAHTITRERVRVILLVAGKRDEAAWERILCQPRIGDR